MYNKFIDLKYTLQRHVPPLKRFETFYTKITLICIFYCSSNDLNQKYLRKVLFP